MPRLPYAPRPGQERLAAAVATVQRTGGALLAEAPTGLGKTIAVLSAGVATIRADGRKLVVATRTNSQQVQVIREHAALRRAGTDPGLLIPFMGRKQYCPLLRDDARFKDGTAEELGRMCRDAKQKARQAQQTGKEVQGACPYYQKLLKDGTGPVEALLRSLEDGDLGDRVAEAGSCPYEALKALLPEADVVVLPYVFLLDEGLRRRLLDWLGTGADGVHVVVDEAHNLPAAARAYHSPRLGATSLQRAQKEAEEYQDPALAGKVLATSFVDALMRVLYRLVDEFVVDEDGLMPPEAFEEALMMELRVPGPVLHRIATELEQWGEIIREDRRSKGRLPRSYLGSIGAFLHLWHATREAPYVHLAVGGEKPALEAYLLDPAEVLSWLRECWSSVHISGTLRPLEEHAALCGLSDPATLVVDSPFDPARLRLYGIEGLHRRYEAWRQDPRVAERQQAAARALLKDWNGRTGLFFPSHEMLRDTLEEGFLVGLPGTAYVEEAGMTTLELNRLVRRFLDDPGPAYLCGVLGGRLTEGIDYPGDAMSSMLLFGIPYPRPSARQQALIHHFDRVHGKGWDYAVHNPTGRILRQAVGRLIRGPDDAGTVVVLDDRIVRFRAMLPQVEMVADVADVAPVGAPAPVHQEGFVPASDLASKKA